MEIIILNENKNETNNKTGTLLCHLNHTTHTNTFIYIRNI